MLVNTLILVVVVAVVSGQGSQFEQDCHILQSLDDIMSRLDSAESDVSNLKSSLTNAETQVTNLKTSLTAAETEITSLKVSLTSADNKIDQQAAEITSLKVSLTAADTKIDHQAAEITSLKVSLTSADTKIDQQASHIETVQDSLATAETDISTLQDSLSTAETEITTLKDALATAETAIETLINSQTELSQPTNVLFHVQDIAAQPTNNNAILFLTVVENVGDAYNITSGCFTAPIGGAYWFSAQICTFTNKNLSPSLIIRGTVASRVWVRDSDWFDCGSVTAVAILEVGDRACLKSGPVQSTDPVWSYVEYNANNFMGAIIN